MEMQRLIIQMAFATDLTGQNPQAASEEAMRRALSQADIPAITLLGVPKDQRRIQVSLGAPNPDALDIPALTGLLPEGLAELRCVPGGQMVTDPETGAKLQVVTAAAEVFLPRQSAWVLQSADASADVASSSEAP